MRQRENYSRAVRGHGGGPGEKPFRKEALAVLNAAIVGFSVPLFFAAVVFFGIYVKTHTAQMTYDDDIWNVLAVYWTIPSSYLQQITGIHVDEFIVNSLLGSIFAGGSAFVWQFVFKPDRQSNQKES